VTSDTPILARSDIATLVPLEDCILAVEAAWRESAWGPAPSPGILGVPAPRGGFHVKTAGLDRGRPSFAVKLNALFPESPVRRGLPTIQGVVALFDGDDGRLLALLDSMEVTRLRTGAATAVAARHLSRPDASRVALFGCGVQGDVPLRALRCVRPLRHAVAATSTARPQSAWRGAWARRWAWPSRPGRARRSSWPGPRTSS
jgi:ornithine cyclodeaminase/alanine dehydrogenase-like protein (mu-crystallin family)